MPVYDYFLLLLFQKNIYDCIILYMDFLPEGINFNRDITYLARTNYRKDAQLFGIKRKDRRQHMYVLGKSGTGKSVFLENMIVQNIWNGEGVCVVDPHGELVEKILSTIPAHRAKDVVYFNPADTDYHIGFNVLEVDDPRYKHLVSSGLMGIFTKLWANVWSARMEYILNNAILALIDTPGSTLLGIPRMLVDKDYRQIVIGNLKDPVIKAFWVQEFEAWREQYRNEAIAPIQNKVGQFLSASIVRNVIGQSKSTIDLFGIMNSGKIFLVNVSKGRIGEDNSALLGGMLITKIQLAAMERVRIPEDERKDFYLYVDEFQNFVTDSFASILSEARKYRLNLTVAHQYIAQLSTKDSDTVRDAVFGNVGTMIIFRVGAVDGEFLEKEFDPEFTPQDMVNLPNYKIYLKLMVDGVTSRPFSASTLAPFKVPEDSNVKQQIIDSSRTLYARPREDVEREIFEWSGMSAGPINTTAGEGGASGGASSRGSNGGGNNSMEGKFKAICSSCGKETTVPFEPEPGRPVYCRDCIAKIKSGELQPVKTPRPQSPKPPVQSEILVVEVPVEQKSVDKPLVKEVVEQIPVVVQKINHAPAVPKVETVFKPVVPVVVHTSRVVEPQISKTPERVRVIKQKVSYIPPPPRESKGPDHDGLQSILKQALGEALRAGAEYKKEVRSTVVVEEPKKEEKKTISLSSLKHHEHVQPKTEVKEASQERMSALQEAIMKAKNSNTVNNNIPKEKINSTESETPQEKDVPVSSPEPEKNPEQNSDVSPKKVREVPEDVLRSLLE